MENKNTAVVSLIVAVCSIGILFFINSFYGKNHIDKWTSESPIRFLSIAQKKLNENKPHEAITNIATTIKIIRKIEYFGDSTANKYLENAIVDLETVIDEIGNDEVSLRDLNMAIFEALNAVAYADLKLSEVDLKNGDDKKAFYLLKTTLLALKRSTNYTQARDELMEEKVISDLEIVLDSLETTMHIDNTSLEVINKEIETLLDREFVD